MESVYFGKENTVLNYSEDKTGGKSESDIKEYYFPDERRTGFKALRLISALLLTGFIDYAVICIGYMMYFIYNSYEKPLYKYIDVEDMVLLNAVMFAFAFACILITPLFYNAGREKTYVRYGNTFYILRYSVRVRINKYFFLSSTDAAEKRIHKRYSRYISQIDNMIEKGRCVRKVLTDCKESDNVDATSGTISGFNEKKFRDEEFRIPARYSKYDPEKKYYTPSIIPFSLFIIIKIVIYITAYILILNGAKVKYDDYKDQLRSYIRNKDGIMAPLGYGFVTDNIYSQDFRLVFTKISDPDQKVVFYTGYNNNIIRDITVGIDLFLNYDDDLDEVYDLVQTTAHINMREVIDLEEFVEQFRNGTLEDTQISENINGKTIRCEIRSSYPADYNLYIYMVLI